MCDCALNPETCRIPLVCDAGGFNTFKDHNLGNATELECLGNFELEGFDEGHVCSEKAWCKTPLNYGPLAPTLPDDYDGALLVEDTEIVYEILV